MGENLKIRIHGLPLAVIHLFRQWKKGGSNLIDIRPVLTLSCVVMERRWPLACGASGPGSSPGLATSISRIGQWVSHASKFLFFFLKVVESKCFIKTFRSLLSIFSRFQ